MRVRTTLGIMVIVLGIAAAVAQAAPGSSPRKDKAALMLYGGFLDSPILIDRADTANMVDIALLRIRGASVPVEELSNRPCIGVALFTRDGWAELQERGLGVGAIRPEMAQVNVRLYPALGGDSAAIYDPYASASEMSGTPMSGGTAWIASAAPRLGNTSVPVEAPPGASVRCDVTP